MSDAFTSDTYNALCKEAETYLSRGLTEQARELLLKAVSLIGTRSRARSLLADSCMSLGLWAEAREQLEQLTTLEIGSIQHHYRLGQVLEEMGEVEVARDNYLVVLDIDRDHRGAAAAMARLAGRTPQEPAPEPPKAPPKPATDFQIFPDDANATDEFASGDEVESLLKDIGVSPDGGADTGVTELLSKVGISLENPAAKEPERDPTDISRLLGEDAVKKDRPMSLEDIFGTGPAVPREQEEESGETAVQASEAPVPAAAGEIQVEPGGFDLASVFGGPGKVDSAPVEGLETAAAKGPAVPSPAAPPVQGLETFFREEPEVAAAAEPPASLEKLFEGGEMAADIPVSNEPPTMEALFTDSPADGAHAEAPSAEAVPAPEPAVAEAPEAVPQPEAMPEAKPEAPGPVEEPPALESIFAEAPPAEAVPVPEPAVAEALEAVPQPEAMPEAKPEAPGPVEEPPALESIFAEAPSAEAVPVPEPAVAEAPEAAPEPEAMPEAKPEAPGPVEEPPALESIFAEAPSAEAPPAPEPAAGPSVDEAEVRGAPGIEIVFGAAASEMQPAMQAVLEGAAGFSIDHQGPGAPVTVRLEQGELDVRTAFLLAMDAGLEMHSEGQRRFLTGRGTLVLGQASRMPVVLELSRGDLVRMDKLAVFDRALSLTDAGIPDLPSMHRVEGAAGLALAFTGGPTAVVDTAGGALARATSVLRLEAGVTVSRAAGPEGFVRLDGEGTAVVAP